MSEAGPRIGRLERVHILDGDSCDVLSHCERIQLDALPPLLGEVRDALVLLVRPEDVLVVRPGDHGKLVIEIELSEPLKNTFLEVDRFSPPECNVVLDTIGEPAWCSAAVCSSGSKFPQKY